MVGKKKLTDDEVEVIRYRLFDRGEFAVDLAREYGVSESTISLIKNGKRRKGRKDG